MRTANTLLAVTALFGSAVFGQTPVTQSQDQVFHFTYTNSSIGQQEILNVIRTIAEVEHANLEVTARTLTIAAATPGQVAMAVWLFNLLDRPAGAQPSPAPGQTAAINTYPVTGSSAVVRVFYLADSEAPKDIQEIVNTIRTIPEMTRVIQCTSIKAVVLRGTADQVAVAEWLIQKLDLPATAQPVTHAPGAVEYLMPGVRDNTIRVFYLTNTPTPQGLQDVTNATRTIPEITRVITRSSLRAITVRGPADEVAAAAWLINLLDQPASAGPAGQPGTPAQYQMPGPAFGVARVFYLTHTGTPQGLQEITNAVRTTAQIQRAILCSGPRALALRGTDKSN